VIEAQIEERKNRKAEEARKLAAEEAAEEERLSRERADIAERFKREEDERKREEEEERRAALEEQIAAKKRAKEAEEALERDLAAREESKLLKQRKELADAFNKDHHHTGSGGADSAGGGLGKVGHSPARTMAAQQQGGFGGEGGGGDAGKRGGEEEEVGGGGGGGKNVRARLFGQSSPPPFPGERTLSDFVSSSSRVPPGSDFNSGVTTRGGNNFSGSFPSDASVRGGGFPQQQQQQQQPQHSHYLAPQAEGFLPQRLIEAESELGRLRSAISALQLQQSDSAFISGIERLGLPARMAGGTVDAFDKENHAAAAAAARLGAIGIPGFYNTNKNSDNIIQEGGGGAKLNAPFGI